ncbi:hypothetical protein G9A89_023933 [Geosiphon pyriformis]|nr:hypothetical protein G9A89_023933 [Geosiphon pyriformis]
MANFAQTFIYDLTALLENSDVYDVVIWAGDPNGTTGPSGFVKDSSSPLPPTLHTSKPNQIVDAEIPAHFKKIKAHSLLLRARSPYFRRALSQEWAKKEDGLFVFKKPNILPCVFEAILKYFYIGLVNLEKYSCQEILYLLIAADELEILELVTHAQDFLIAHKSVWLRHNIVTLLHTITRHDEAFPKLKNHCLKMVSDEPYLIFESENFLSFEDSVLVALLKRDDLGMEEVEIWNSLVRWGISNTPEIASKDVTLWSPDDFIALEQTLHECVSLIRYSAISGEDYFEYVVPYKKILPKFMRKEILGYHLKGGHQQIPRSILPPRSGSIGSNIIKPKHATLIASWIDESIDPIISQYQYKFKLIYRASRDGFAAAVFRELCADVTNTLVIAKISGSGKIVGGYNPSNWGGKAKGLKTITTSSPWASRSAAYSYQQSFQEQYQRAPDAFIFSLGDGLDLKNVRLSRSHSRNNAIAYRQDYGPYFYSDLFIGDNCNIIASCWYNHNNYQKCIFYDLDDFEAVLKWHEEKDTQNGFKLDDYEVFQVIPK